MIPPTKSSGIPPPTIRSDALRQPAFRPVPRTQPALRKPSSLASLRPAVSKPRPRQSLVKKPSQTTLQTKPLLQPQPKPRPLRQIASSANLRPLRQVQPQTPVRAPSFTPIFPRLDHGIAQIRDAELSFEDDSFVHSEVDSLRAALSFERKRRQEDQRVIVGLKERLERQHTVHVAENYTELVHHGQRIKQDLASQLEAITRLKAIIAA